MGVLFGGVGFVRGVDAGVVIADVVVDVDVVGGGGGVAGVCNVGVGVVEVAGAGHVVVVDGGAVAGVGAAGAGVLVGGGCG